jgi:hypothetical protein
MTVTTTSFQEELGERILAGTQDAFVIDLLPRDAELLLELNRNNRPPRSRVSDQYAADMKSGRWLYAAEPLKFDVEGVLLDGQHRLMGLASLINEAPELSIKFMIVTGLDKQSQSVMDQGSKRTAGDNLSLSGIKNANEVAAAARAFILWTGERMFVDQRAATARVSNTEVQEWVVNHPEFVEACFDSIKHKKDVDLAARLYMAAYAVFRQIDKDAASEFLSMWVSGVNLHVGHPVLTLREKLGRIRRERTTVTDRDALAMVVTAWNHYREGRMLLRFTKPKGGVWTKANFPNAI